MKKITVFLFTILLMANPIVPSSAWIPIRVPGSTLTDKKEYHRIILDVLTIYNPTEKQCDATPLLTASNAQIKLDDLRNQKIRWMALSRELLMRWNGQFQYGDTVRLNANDSNIDGLWVIQDTMNKRFKRRGDLLFDSSVRKWGRWENVEIINETRL